METETIYYICKICEREVTRGYLSNQGMINKCCIDCIYIRNNQITDKYIKLIKTMSQAWALDSLEKEYGLCPASMLQIIIKTKKERNQNDCRPKVQNPL